MGIQELRKAASNQGLQESYHVVKEVGTGYEAETYFVDVTVNSDYTAHIYFYFFAKSGVQ